MTCLSGVGDKPMVISTQQARSTLCRRIVVSRCTTLFHCTRLTRHPPLQRVAMIQLECPSFDRCPVFPALSIRRHVDDANLTQVELNLIETSQSN